MDTLAWSEIREYLLERLDAARSTLDNATGDTLIYRAQGDVRTLRSLLNLPAILTQRREDRKT